MDKFPSNINDKLTASGQLIAAGCFAGGVKWQSIGEIVYTVKKRGENYMKVLILYFSATGNTAKIAKVIEEKFKEEGVRVTMSDITPFGERQRKIDFEPYQAVVFGAPAHSRRAPRVVRDWLRTLDGQGKKCSMFFTYGGFGVHPSHYSTRQILKEQNFIVVSSGMDVAEHIAGICHIVFVTAYDRYAVKAFEQEAADYLLKPVSKERLMQTVQRLKDRLESTSLPSQQLNEAVRQIISKLPGEAKREYLRWIKTQYKDSVRLIPVEEIDYFKADNKYTLVMTKEGESLIRKSIKELVDELNPARFWQIHRGTIVKVSRIDKVSHSLTGRGIIKLKEREELLTVSRSYLHLFKYM